MCAVGGVVVVLVLVVLFSAVDGRRGGHGLKGEAMNHAKQVGMYLIEFAVDYGSFPGDSTATEVAKNSGSPLDFYDGSSNAVFRQLIAYGCDSEEIFFCRHPEGLRGPDHRISGTHALEAGEVGFSYVHGQSDSSSPDTPILLFPMVSSSYDRFWAMEVYREKAMILRADLSVDWVPIRESGQKAVDEHGIPIMDAAQRYLGGSWPDMRHPKF